MTLLIINRNNYNYGKEYKHFRKNDDDRPPHPTTPPPLSISISVSVSLLLQIVPSTQSRGTRKSYFTFYFTQKLYGTGVLQTPTSPRGHPLAISNPKKKTISFTKCKKKPKIHHCFFFFLVFSFVKFCFWFLRLKSLSHLCRQEHLLQSLLRLKCASF